MKSHGNVLLMSLFLFQPLVANDDTTKMNLDAGMSSLGNAPTPPPVGSTLMSAVSSNGSANHKSEDSMANPTSDSKSSSVDLQKNVATGFPEVALPSTDSLVKKDTGAISAPKALVKDTEVDPLASVVASPKLTIPSAPKETDLKLNDSAKSTSAPISSVNSEPKTSLVSTPTLAPVEDDVTVTVDDSQQIDLDTMTIGVGGNWLQKRVYYEKAAALYEEIQDEVNSSEDARLNFLSEINSLHKSIDEFYEKVAFGQGQIKALLDSYTTALNMEEERNGDLSKDERAMRQTIVDEQAQVSEIGDSITVISDLDEKVDEVMQLVFTTIDSCRDYQSKAWDNFKEITQSLDDQKARTLYYEMENFSDNIEQQISYLNNTLFPFLKTTLGGQITSNIGIVESALTDLESKGVDLGTEIKKFFGENIDAQEERKKLEIDEASKQAVEDYKKDAAKKQAELDAKEAAERQEALEGSFIYKFVVKVICPIKAGWSWLSSHLGFLEKPVAVASQAAQSSVCMLGCWLSKLKFW